MEVLFGPYAKKNIPTIKFNHVEKQKLGNVIVPCVFMTLKVVFNIIVILPLLLTNRRSDIHKLMPYIFVKRLCHVFKYEKMMTSR